MFLIPFIITSKDTKYLEISKIWKSSTLLPVKTTKKYKTVFLREIKEDLNKQNRVYVHGLKTSTLLECPQIKVEIQSTVNQNLNKLFIGINKLILSIALKCKEFRRAKNNL